MGYVPQFIVDCVKAAYSNVFEEEQFIGYGFFNLPLSVQCTSLDSNP